MTSEKKREMRSRAAEEFGMLVDTVATLRSPGGCPWDREQTHSSLKSHAIEETYEVVEAIESGDPQKLKDELGDFLLQAMLHAQIASEAGEFDIADVCATIRQKLVRRHPHVFADVEISGVQDVLDNWEQIKKEEYGHRKSALDGVPRSLPALMRAVKLSKKAAKTGFDWPDIHSVIDKLKEETCELEEAIERGDDAAVSEELGDILFTAVNIARFKRIDPEQALRDMLVKFVHRFGQIERRAAETGRSIGEMTMDEMEQVWNDAKKRP